MPADDDADDLVSDAAVADNASASGSADDSDDDILGIDV